MSRLSASTSSLLTVGQLHDTGRMHSSSWEEEEEEEGGRWWLRKYSRNLRALSLPASGNSIALTLILISNSRDHERHMTRLQS